MKALTAFIIRKIIKRRKFHCLLLGQLKADQIKVIKAITGISETIKTRVFYLYNLLLGGLAQSMNLWTLGLL